MGGEMGDDFVRGPISPGETFDRYTIETLIGRGGMGEVYRATDTRLRRKVALKVLRPDRAAGYPDAVARLFREARAAASLNHPNTVAIHDLGEHDGTFFLVMELVNGASLHAYVRDARVPLARKVGWLIDITKALAAAHKAGVLHRDVKPSNVMIGEGDVVKVLDFGLAKPLDPVSFRTQAGHVVGTPKYMAPELFSGGEADPLCDQYAFGLLAYELVTGVHPGGALSPDPPKPLVALEPEAPGALASVIARAMATNPEDRFESMEAVGLALEDIRAGRPVRASFPKAAPPKVVSETAIPTEPMRGDWQGRGAEAETTASAPPKGEPARGEAKPIAKTLVSAEAPPKADVPPAPPMARTLLSARGAPPPPGTVVAAVARTPLPPVPAPLASPVPPPPAPATPALPAATAVMPARPPVASPQQAVRSEPPPPRTGAGRPLVIAGIVGLGIGATAALYLGSVYLDSRASSASAKPSLESSASATPSQSPPSPSPSPSVTVAPSAEVETPPLAPAPSHAPAALAVPTAFPTAPAATPRGKPSLPQRPLGDAGHLGL